MNQFSHFEHYFNLINHNGILFQLMMSWMIWTLLYKIIMNIPILRHKATVSSEGKPIKLSEMEIVDVDNRAISFIHGLSCCILSYIEITYYKNSYGGENTLFQNFTLIMSSGYFIFNTVSMTYYRLLDSSMAFHHIIVIMMFVDSVYFNTSGAELVGGLFITEISNPTMHFRLFLKTYGLRHTKVYEACEYVYILLYTYNRLIWGTYAAIIINIPKTLGFRIKLKQL